MPILHLLARCWALLRLILLCAVLAGCGRMPPAPAVTPIPSAPAAPAPTPTLPPTRTPSPQPSPSRPPTLTFTPTPTVCLDQMTVLLRLDLAQADPAAPPVLPAGAPGQAGWRVRNTGTCLWDTSYSLVLTGGELVYALDRRVPPGETLDLPVTFDVPPQPGTHTLAWQLVNGRGQAVSTPGGEGLAVRLAAVDAPVPTLPPGVALRAYPEIIQPDERTTLSWNVQGAREVYFYHFGQDWRRYPTRPQGSIYDTPAHSTTYELRVVRGDDSVEIYRVRVEVAPYAPPEIKIFRPRRAGLGTPTACIVLEWEVRGRSSLLIVLRNGQLLWSGTDAVSSLRDCPNRSEPVVYTLIVDGPGGESQATCAIH